MTLGCIFPPSVVALPFSGPLRHNLISTPAVHDDNDTLNNIPPAILPRWFSMKSNEEVARESITQLARSKSGELWPAKHFPAGSSLYPAGAVRTFIPFCFVKDEDASALSMVTAQAIARWWPAFKYSSLMLIPDMNCHAPVRNEEDVEYDLRCICGKQPNNGKSTGPDTLHISIAKGSEFSEAGTGYLGNSETEGRHNLQIMEYPTKAEDGQYGGFLQMRDMMHELGHVMGLNQYALSSLIAAAS